MEDAGAKKQSNCIAVPFSGTWIGEDIKNK